jgi:hypothetical protein
MEMADKHPNCIHPLCGCDGTGNCRMDPMNTPLPCDIKIGGGTMRKGVRLGTLVLRMEALHKAAFGDDAEALKLLREVLPYISRHSMIYGKVSDHLNAHHQLVAMLGGGSAIGGVTVLDASASDRPKP